MKRASKLHIGNLGKSFLLPFFAITVIWGIISHRLFGGIYLDWKILLGNFAVSAAISAVIYLLYFHNVIEYDEGRFMLRRGTKKTEGRWEDFSLVSLYHKGFGILAVRIYRGSNDESDCVEIPADDLGLDASDFRFEVTGFLKKD
ncbi:MAG: hypothetical protein E3J72_09560 [Planctomycetota bacterium]|nr:MAG: hypothetical protein E3J72_09560 [Planctomycetota bacterium]